MIPQSASVTVVIPVFNDSKNLARCLNALKDSSFKDFDVVVVDDCSSDDSADVAERAGCKVIRLKDHSAPAIARNKGASVATGRYIIFLDSDVICGRKTFAELVKSLDNGCDACIGIYAPVPGHANFFSMYKNIFIWNYHNFSEREIDWFWTACGAIKKDVFDVLGGFDSFFTWKSVEDIELGYRMTKDKYKIFLNKSAVVTHLHCFRLKGILRNDFKKGKDWTFLNLAKNHSMAMKHPVAQFRCRGTGIILNLIFIITAALAVINIRFLPLCVLIFLIQPLAERRLFASLWHYGGIKIFTVSLFFKIADDLVITIGVLSGLMNFYRKRGKVEFHKAFTST